MAEISYTRTKSLHEKVFTWEGATNGGSPDTFNAVVLDRTPYSVAVQTDGNYSGSASFAIHGSLDGTNFIALEDRQGDAVALTADGLVELGSAPKYLKPVMTSGDSSADVDVTMLVRFDTL